MKSRPLALVCAFGAAGLLVGYGGKFLLRGSREVIPAPPGDHRDAKPGPVGLPRSRDTLESLAALNDKSLYVRLARWMATASGQEIAAYWEIHRRQGPRDHEITELTLINWTRLDPQAAIDSASTTGDGQSAWQAWACTNPQAALTAAIAADSDCLMRVARAIEKYHPGWLRLHFDMLPDSVRASVFKEMKSGDDPNPLAAVEFLKTNHQRIDREVLGALIRKDPKSAYAWFRNNGRELDRSFQVRGWALDYFAKTLNECHPEALAEIARQAPAGEFKRSMESVLFDNLLKSDPQLATEQAKAETAPRIATQRLAAVGLSVVNKDPDTAIDLLKLMLPFCGRPTLTLPNRIKFSGEYGPGVYSLVEQLAISKPEEMMELAISQGGASNDRMISFSQVSQRWAQEDLNAYADWINQQADPAVRAPAEDVLISGLQCKRQYATAAEWVMSSEASQSRNLESFLRAWREDQPENALQWLESANISPAKKQQLQRNTKPFGP